MSKEIEVGSDFSGVGAFDYAIKRITNKSKTIFACDMDKFARQSYVANHGEPDYYPENVYDREIPEKSLDIYMTSPPCQSFSLAGNRKGKDSENGVLFFNSHEFIKVNKPRYFIFENVKGLLSDDKTNPKDEFGNTFKEWTNMLGGKSINGNAVLFPFENSVPYHIYHKVLNSKKHGVPQNRERVFIIGIRDDEDNSFTWPKEEHLTKKLKDILETDVDEKYFLSEKMLNALLRKGTDYEGCFQPHTEEDVSKCLTARYYKMGATDPYIKVKSATSKGYETATENDSINFTHPDSKTRRGRVGKEVAQTLDTACNQGIIRLNNPKHSQERVYSVDGISPTVSAGSNGGGQNPVKHLTYDMRIRRLTPRECHRLQDFPETHKLVCSDSQSYKQAGNSITVRVLELIIRKFNL